MKLGYRKLEHGHAAFEIGDVSLNVGELRVDSIEAHPRKVDDFGRCHGVRIIENWLQRGQPPILRRR